MGDGRGQAAGRPAPGDPPRKRPRWGVRTIGFLVLAFVAMITAVTLGHHTIGTLGSLVFGLGGAAYCSIKGLRDANERGLRGILSDRRPDR